MPFPLKLIERFFRHVDKNLFVHPIYGPCWIWTGSTRAKGYGQFQIDGHPECAHRMSWRIHNGLIGDLQVLHKCDVKLCVNPEHLFLGTQLDNMRDKIVKGRQNIPFGEDQGNHKLYEEDVLRIRQLRLEGWTYSSISELFDVHEATIGKIVRGERWPHI